MGTLQAVFFDIDGVLADSLSEHLRFCQDMSDRYDLNLKIPNPIQFKQDFIRKDETISPMHHFLTAVGFPEKCAEKADEHYRDKFMSEYTPAIFPGIEKMLAHLDNERLLLGIVTANVQQNVEKVLQKCVVHFRQGCCFFKDTHPDLSKADSLIRGVELLNLTMDQCLYIGDQPKDWEAAQEAGMNFLGVTYGWGISKEDKEFPIADNAAQICTYILNQLGH